MAFVAPIDSTMWGPQDSSVGANNSNNYGLWYANNELVTGANLNQQTSLGGLTF